jgi:hypothetical protein
VYFGRTAALLEGIGTRYDPYFQVISVASPVILKLHRRILKSLGENVAVQREDVMMIAGEALGRVARWINDQVQAISVGGTK